MRLEIPARLKRMRSVPRMIRRLPNLLRGYGLFANPDKFQLIDHAFTTVVPQARSFADLGGIWRVHGAYTRYALDRYPVERGICVDTDCPPSLEGKLNGRRGLTVVRGDFAQERTAAQVGPVDVVLFFDVLLHQANPHWDEVLRLYARHAPTVVIYNQQWVRDPHSVRLVDLPLEEYTRVTSDRREEVYRHVYAMGTAIHPEYGKPWRDIHNIAQWGVTDGDLRETMEQLGYEEVFFRNDGRFLDLPAFENHAFIFVPRPGRA
jgi:hypothetical protein